MESGTKEEILNGLLVAIESQVSCLVSSLPHSSFLVKVPASKYWYTIRTTLYILDIIEEVEQVSN